MMLPRRLRTTTPATLRKTMRETLDSLGSDGPVVVVSASGHQRGILVSPEDYDALIDQLEASLAAQAALRGDLQGERGEGIPIREGLAARASRSSS